MLARYRTARVDQTFASVSDVEFGASHIEMHNNPNIKLCFTIEGSTGVVIKGLTVD